MRFAILRILSIAYITVSAKGPAPYSIVSTGLRNLGNTCYLNAQLQCAFHIPRVRELILKESKPTDNNVVGDSTGATEELKESPIWKESPGLKALRQVFREMEVAHQQKNGPVTPLVLAVTLGIPVLEQQDSEEFWKLLLPALNVPDLTQLYQGSFEDYIVALDGSKRERRRNEKFLDLSLDVVASSGQKSSLMSSLHKMFGPPELLSVAEGNGWRPEKGADKVDAHKGSRLLAEGLPSILQLHLKRFNYDWNRDVMEKLNDPLTFPAELDLSQLICNGDDNNNDNKKDATIYDLQSVVVHAGEFGVGHYYAYVRPNFEEGEGCWYRFNDDVVTLVSFEDVVTDATGGQVKLSDSAPPTKRRRGLFGCIQQIFEPSSFGFGGRTSNAYVLQYVRRSAKPYLYCSTTEAE